MFSPFVARAVVATLGADRFGLQLSAICEVTYSCKNHSTKTFSGNNILARRQILLEYVRMMEEMWAMFLFGRVVCAGRAIGGELSTCEVA
jgi:hypothetical protein